MSDPVADAEQALVAAQAALDTALVTKEEKRQAHVEANAAGWTAFNAYKAAEADAQAAQDAVTAAQIALAQARQDAQPEVQ